MNDDRHLARIIERGKLKPRSTPEEQEQNLRDYLESL